MTPLGPELQAEVRNAAFEAAYEFGRFAGNGPVSVREFEQAFRAGFLHQASEVLKANDTEATEARLALSSGMTRSEVQQALAALSEWDRDAPRESFSEDGIFEGLSLLISLWNSDSRFTQMYGVPRDLLIRRQSGQPPSLEDAASIALPSVPIERVLQELAERALISIDRNAGTARLIADTMPIQNFQAHASVRFGRLTAGLMRTLRINLERRAEGSNARRMWEKTFWTDRPIAASKVPEFLALVDDSVKKWMVKLDGSLRSYSALNDEAARRYCIAVFALKKPVDDDTAQGYLPLLHTTMTTAPIRSSTARDFMFEVNDTATLWLNALDSEQHEHVAAPGEPSASIEICAFMFDVAGSRGDTDATAIDLAKVRAATR